MSTGRCADVGTHEWMTWVCTRPAGHPGRHRNDEHDRSWETGGPVTDLRGRHLLLGTPKPEPIRRRRTWSKEAGQ